MRPVLRGWVCMMAGDCRSPGANQKPRAAAVNARLLHQHYNNPNTTDPAPIGNISSCLVAGRGKELVARL
jgi:hypothetical protein